MTQVPISQPRTPARVSSQQENTSEQAPVGLLGLHGGSPQVPRSHTCRLLGQSPCGCTGSQTFGWQVPRPSQKEPSGQKLPPVSQVTWVQMPPTWHTAPPGQVPS